MTQAEFISVQSSALTEATCLLGESFTYKGTAYRAVVNDLEYTEDLLMGGLFQGFGAIVIVSRLVLTSIPKVGETVYAKGTELRIQKIKADETSLELTCISASA